MNDIKRPIVATILASAMAPGLTLDPIEIPAKQALVRAKSPAEIKRARKRKLQRAARRKSRR